MISFDFVNKGNTEPTKCLIICVDVCVSAFCLDVVYACMYFVWTNLVDLRKKFTI